MKTLKMDKNKQAKNGVADNIRNTHKESQPAGIGKNIPEVYGVRQIQDAITFIASYPNAKTVQIAGDFNAWQPHKNPMLKISENGVWQLKLRLARGTYRYRLVVDGQWQQDPHNKSTEPNQYGEFNSVLTVS